MKEHMGDRSYTFIFADLSGFTAMTETHGDEDAADVALGSRRSRGRHSSVMRAS